jgi:hypothetical protein
MYDNDVWLYDNIVRKRDVEALGRSKVKYENVYKLSVISRRAVPFDNFIAGRIHEALLSEGDLEYSLGRLWSRFPQLFVFSYFQLF